MPQYVLAVTLTFADGEADRWDRLASKQGVSVKLAMEAALSAALPMLEKHLGILPDVKADHAARN